MRQSLIRSSIFHACFLACSVVFVAPAEALTFRKAKKEAVKIYKNHEEAFYSGCSYKYQGKKLVPEASTCGYTPRKPITKKGKTNARSVRIEWEHVMPAWVFGHQRQCWQRDLDGNGKKDGRKGCKKDPVFAEMEGDLHNLVPAIGELNGDRSNFSFSMLEGERRLYGNPDFEVDFKRRIVEPRPEVRGDIARIYFYMADRYKLRLSSKEKKLFEAWSKQDPVSEWERKRDQMIQAVQGNHNPFVQ
ncbi:MAG: endonuclease [Sneathiella sp.]